MFGRSRPGDRPRTSGDQQGSDDEREAGDVGAERADEAERVGLREPTKVSSRRHAGSGRPSPPQVHTIQATGRGSDEQHQHREHRRVLGRVRVRTDHFVRRSVGSVCPRMVFVEPRISETAMPRPKTRSPRSAIEITATCMTVLPRDRPRRAGCRRRARRGRAPARPSRRRGPLGGLQALAETEERATVPRVPREVGAEDASASAGRPARRSAPPSDSRDRVVPVGRLVVARARPAAVTAPFPRGDRRAPRPAGLGEPRVEDGERDVEDRRAASFKPKAAFGGQLGASGRRARRARSRRRRGRSVAAARRAAREVPERARHGKARRRLAACASTSSQRRKRRATKSGVAR